MADYDFIVIGSGSSGGVLAARLTESGKYSVLCLEAGIDDYVWTRPPGGTAFMIENPKVNWCRYSTPNASTGNRPLYVPTMKELGFGDFSPRIWYAFLVPAGTKPEVVSRIQDAFAKAVTDATVLVNLNARGYIAEVRGSAEAAAFLKAESARWKKVIQENNITSLD